MSDTYDPVRDVIYSTLHTMPLGMMLWVLDETGARVIDWNPACERIFGWKREEVLGRDFREFLPAPSMRDEVDELVAGFLADPAPVNTHAHCQTADGRIRLVDWYCTPTRDPQTGTVYVVSLSEDVTDRIEAAERLADSERRYRFLFHGNPLPMWVYDIQTLAFLEVNDAAIRKYGYSREEFLAMTLADIRPSEDVPRLVANVAAVTEGMDEAGVWRHVLKDGTVRQVDITSHALDWEGRRAELVLALDVTERVEAESELRRYRHELEQMVEARTAQLKEANDRLEEATSAKSRFLANMSHELRTPLNSIIGFSGILLQGMAGALSDEQSTQIKMVNRSGRQLLAIVNDILDLSRIEAGRLELKSTDFEAGPLLAELLGMVRPQADEKDLTLTLSLAADLPDRLRTDRDRLGQILLNLLSNAVKFTDSGSVTLEATADARTVTFRVADTGIGIAADELDDIFESFHQIEAKGLSPGGTGLGLAISRDLAHLLGGTLGVVSEVGVGSTFTLRLPLAAK